MLLNEIVGFTPQIGKAYILSDNIKLGDYRNNEVYVETGPRGSGQSLQYRISYGPGNYDVDWIDAWMFDGCKELPSVPEHLVYKKSKK